MKKVSRRSLFGTAVIGTAAAFTAAAPAVYAQGAGKKEQSGGTWDVVVVSAGTAGIVCAITAHDLGARFASSKRQIVPTAILSTLWASWPLGVPSGRKLAALKTHAKRCTPT